MDYKLVTLILLIGVFYVTVEGDHGKDPGHYRKKKIDEKCGTDQICIAAAEKCLGDKNAPLPNDTMTYTEKLAAFNTCLQSNGKEANVIKEETCSAKRGSRDVLSKKEYEKCKKEIFAYLRTLEESADPAAGAIRCCHFHAIGVEMVKPDNSINLEFFRQHLQERISNAGVLKTYEGAFEACLPKGEMCNVHGFRECVMDECISRMQNS